jgi:hypothetical protein
MRSLVVQNNILKYEHIYLVIISFFLCNNNSKRKFRGWGECLKERITGGREHLKKRYSQKSVKRLTINKLLYLCSPFS